MAASSSAALSSLMFSADACPPFIPTAEWQPILPGQTVPPGLWMRMDISTGVRSARTMPVAGEVTAAQQGGQPYSISGTDSEPRAVCAEFIESDHQLPPEDAGTASSAEFFRVYEPIFERYAVFSRKIPAPRLGSADSSDSAVIAFYKFWSSFSSCRELPLNAEEGSAASRSQQQQREHEKRQQAARHMETTLVRRLAADAQRKDPRAARIKKQLDEENAAESAARQARRDAEQAAEQQRQAEAAAAKEELARLQAAEAAAQADRELAQRAADEESKKAAREQQKRLRAAFGKACRSAGLDELHTDYLRAALTTEQLQPMLDAFATDARSPQAKAIFASHLSVLLAVEAAAAEVKAQAQAAAAAAAQAKKDAAASLVWSEAEHAALAKGMAKYTHGVALRWHKITDLVNAVAVRPRDLSDVIARARALERTQGPLGSGPPSKATAAEESAPVAAAAAASSSASPPPAAVRVTASPSPDLPVSPSPSASSSSALSPSSPAAATASSDTSTAASAASPSSSSLSDVPFSVTEQQRLELALQSVSKTAPDRWTQIAAIVSTRTKKECMARYKTIVAHLKAEKQMQQTNAA